MTWRRPVVHRWAPVALILVAWALRLPPLLDSPLHPDEALYGYWGLLISRGRDPWLVADPVYKPPLLPYAIAACQFLLGATRLSLRLPGLVAGTVAVPLVGALAGAIYEDRWTALGATVAMALSPFAVTFSGAAFPDTLMVTLGLAACVAAARGRLLWAGALCGLSFAAKRTGLVWLPVAGLVAAARGLGPTRGGRRFALGYVASALIPFAWDGVRLALGADSFWAAGVVGYGGLRLIWSHELWSRLRAWIGSLASMLGWWPVNVVALLGVAVLVGRGLTRGRRTQRALFDLLLFSFCLTYGLLHWLVAFPVWSRYLLPLAPLLAAMLGRIAGAAAGLWPTHMRGAAAQGVAVGLLAVLLAAPARQASAGHSRLAGEREAYRGVEAVVDYFSELPEGSVVYHHWLGWHYRYALYDAPVYLAYWPTPAWLVRDVQAFGRQGPRYVAFPGWESAARVEEALQNVGYALKPVLAVPGQSSASSVTVYRILPSATP